MHQIPKNPMNNYNPVSHQKERNYLRETWGYSQRESPFLKPMPQGKNTSWSNECYQNFSSPLTYPNKVRVNFTYSTPETTLNKWKSPSLERSNTFDTNKNKPEGKTMPAINLAR